MVPFQPINRRVRQRKRQQVPRWIENPAIRMRILNVYNDYLQCMSIDELVRKYNVTAQTVFRDIRHAREALKQWWLSDLDNMLAERIEARRALIRQAQEQVRVLEESPTGGGLGSMKAHDKAKAMADLLTFIAAQHKAIEELQGFRKLKQNSLDLPQLGEGGAILIGLITDVAGEGTTVRLPEDADDTAYIDVEGREVG